MKKRLRKVLSVALASAMTLGLVITGSGSGLKSVEAAMAVKQDSASEINYAAILGGAVDYGIVADSLIQQGHMESTFATNLYTTNANNDVDYQEKTAHFIIGGLSEGSKITLGKTTATSLYIEAPHKVFEGFDQSQITKDGTYGNFVFAEGFGKIVDGKYVYPPITEVKNQNASANVNRLVNRGAKMAEILAQKANDADYVLSNEYIVDNGKLNINIDSPEFENKVVYIDMDSNMLKRLKDSSGVIINKKSSTVVVFNIDQDAVDTAYGTAPVETNKFEVYVNGIRHVSTTNPKGNKAGGYDDNDKSVTYVEDDKEICQKVIWNFNTTNDVNLSTFAGVMLAPKSNVTFTGGNVSGWLISGKEVNTNGIEFHYVYQGGSTDSYGQMHFSLIKSFTSEYANKDNVVADTSVDIKDGDFGFIWQEYEDDSYADNKKVGEPQEKEVKTDGTVQFPILSFYTGEDHTTDPHYVHKGSAEAPYNDETEDVYEKDPADPTSSGTFIETLYYNTEHFYFKIYEDETKTVPGISNSKGYITIDLKVRVDQYGHFTYVIDSVSKTGDNGEITYTVNDDVGMSGVQFDLGSFFNKTELGSIKLSKTFKFYDRYDMWSGGWQEATTAPVLTHEQKEAIKYTITGPDGFSRVVNYSEFADDGTFTVTDIPIGGPYTITESGQDTANLIGDGYSYHPSTRQDSARSSSPTVTVNKVEKNEVSSAPEIRNSYVKLNDRSGTLVIKKKATKDGSAYSGKFNVAVKNNEGKYLQSMPVPVKDQYDQITGYNVDFSDTAKYFEIEAGGELEIVGLPSGSYKVYEKDVLKANTTVKVNGQSVTSDGEVEAGNVSLNADRKTFTINNDYVSDKGSLKVTKHFALNGANLPYVEKTSYEKIAFTITSVDDPSVTFTAECNQDGHQYGSEDYIVTFKDIPVGEYNVTETAIPAEIVASHIPGQQSEWNLVTLYYSTTTSESASNVSVTKNTTTEGTVFTNNYTETKEVLGNLEIEKELGAGAPASANSMDYVFTVTGPSYPNGTTVKITGAGKETLNDLVPGDYTVVENQADAEISGYALIVTGDDNTPVTVSNNDTAKAKITNTYTQDKGNLKITKELATGAPSEASTKEYSFTVTGPSYPNGTTVKITGAGSKTLSDIVPGEYTIVEDENGAAISGYALTVTGDNNTPVEVAKDGTKEAKITNTYTQDKGNLKITKELATGAPSEASTKEYSFTVTGPSYPNGTTVKITGAGSKTLSDIVPGEYTIVEDENGAAISGYALTVTGDNNTPVTVAKNGTKEATITNKYDQHKGTLKLTKTISGPVTQAEAEGALTFQITTGTGTDKKYVTADGTLTSTETTLKLTDKKSDNTNLFTYDSTTKTWTATFDNVAVGKYDVTETNTEIIDAATGKPYVLKTTSKTSDSKTVSDGATETLALTDDYDAPADEKGTLKLTKTISGPVTQAEAEGALTFQITTGTGTDKKYVTADGTLTSTETTLKLTDKKSDNTNLFTYDSTTKTWTATFNDVEVGTYEVTETNTEIIDAATGKPYVLKTTSKTSDSKTVSDGATETLALTDDYDAPADEKGTLKLTKTISGPVTQAEAEGALTFQITTGTGADKKYVTADGTLTSTETTLKLTDKKSDSTNLFTYDSTAKTWTATFNDVEVGTYEVTETNTAIIDAATGKPYVLKTTSKTSDSKTVSDGATETLALTDDYDAPADEKGTLKLTKTISGPVTQAEAEGALTFQITTGTGADKKYVTADGTLTSTETTLKLTDKKSDNTNLFTYDSTTKTWTATFNDVAVGTYEVTETNTAIIDAATGKPYVLKTTSKTSDSKTVSDGATETLALTDDYDAPVVETGSVSVTKKVAQGSDTFPKQDQTFDFKITLTYPAGTTDAQKRAVAVNTGAQLSADSTVASAKLKVGETLKVSNLPNGTSYVIAEDTTTLPANYTAETTTGLSGTIDVSATATKDIAKDFENRYTAPQYGKLVITKTLAGETDLSKISAITFKIDPAIGTTSIVTLDANYATSGWTKTDNTYTYEFKDLLVGNTYSVEETADGHNADYSCVVEPTSKKVENLTIAKDTEAKAEFKNTYTTTKTSLTIRKSVVNADGITVPATFKVAVRVGDRNQYVQDENGTIGTVEQGIHYFDVTPGTDLVINNLPENTYSITEDTLAAKQGVDPNYGLTVSGEGNITTTVAGPNEKEITNTYEKLPEKTLKVTKTITGGAATTEPFSFTVSAPDDGGTTKYLQADGTLGDAPYTFTVTTDTPNVITIDETAVGRTFTVTEDTALNPSITNYTFDVNESTIAGSAEINTVITAGQVDLVNDYDMLTKQISISKVDATNSKEIAGAELTLYSVGDDGKLTKLTSWTSSATEVYKFTVASGNYAIEETIAPEGYEKKTSLVKFNLSFDANGNAVTKVTEGPGTYDSTADVIKFENDPIKVTGKLSVHVVEEKTGRDVPGAEVEVEYPDGTKKTFTTNDKGEIVDENGKTPIDVPTGEYKVTVTKVPEGYEVTTGETGTVTVPKDGEARHEAKIIPKTGGLTITVLEEGTNRVVPGATVEVEAPDGTTFPDGSKKITVITDENGKVTSYKDKDGKTIDLTTGLTPGDYKITVTKVPEGYKVTTGQTKTVTVKKGEVAEHIALIATNETTPSTQPNTPETKTTPSPQKATTTTTSVNTGDSMNVVPVIIIMVIALAGIVFVIVRKRRSR